MTALSSALSLVCLPRVWLRWRSWKQEGLMPEVRKMSAKCLRSSSDCEKSSTTLHEAKEASGKWGVLQLPSVKNLLSCVWSISRFICKGDGTIARIWPHRASSGWWGMMGVAFQCWQLAFIHSKVWLWSFLMSLKAGHEWIWWWRLSSELQNWHLPSLVPRCTFLSPYAKAPEKYLQRIFLSTSSNFLRYLDVAWKLRLGRSDIPFRCATWLTTTSDHAVSTCCSISVGQEKTKEKTMFWPVTMQPLSLTCHPSLVNQRFKQPKGPKTLLALPDVLASKSKESGMSSGCLARNFLHVRMHFLMVNTSGSQMREWVHVVANHSLRFL